VASGVAGRANVELCLVSSSISTSCCASHTVALWCEMLFAAVKIPPGSTRHARPSVAFVLVRSVRRQEPNSLHRMRDLVYPQSTSLVATPTAATPAGHRTQLA